MKSILIRYLVAICVVMTAGFVNATPPTVDRPIEDASIGRIEVATVPLDPNIGLRTATYTPSGKVLIAYHKGDSGGPRDLSLAVMDDDGKNMRTFFSQSIPERPKDNGIRFMIFPDNQRIFMGDFVLECTPNIDRCDRSVLYPVEYPEQVAGGDHIAHRWSEMIIAPDNEHIAWTTLFSNYSAAVFTGKFNKESGIYRIVSPRMISNLDAFRADPKHPDGVIPNPVRNGEVKQFVAGGVAISLVGAKDSDIADSVVQYLDSDKLIQITHTPGYDETTIFSPDERLGIVMSSRFSRATDLAILGLMPKPFPASLNMGLNSYAYTYSVTGVRGARGGNIGPALIDIEASKTRGDYLGINLNTQDEWVFGSPMSWHPSGKKAMWMEGQRDTGRLDRQRRIQVVHLLDYKPGPTVVARPTPDEIPYAGTDLTAIKDYLQQGSDIDVKIYGGHSGYIKYSRNAKGMIEKIYENYSDDGESVYSGNEKIQLNPLGYSTYTADVKLSGPEPGVMALKVTFGPLQGPLPAEIIFAEDSSGVPLSYGYAEYDGQRLNVNDLVR